MGWDHERTAIEVGNSCRIINNHVVGFRDGISAVSVNDTEILDNYIEARFHTIYAPDAKGDNVINNNTLKKYTSEGDWFINLTNASSVSVKNNICEGLGGAGFYFNNTILDMSHNLIVTPGVGVEISNQVQGSVLNNTIISTNNGDYGLTVSNQSFPSIRNNIIQGYTTGMYLENDFINNNVSHNGFWDISGDIYSGNAIADQMGELITYNNNSDVSDIYGNIYMDPMFVNQDSSDYNLIDSSPYINAGSPSYTDVDGSISDIGAFYFDSPAYQDSITNVSVVNLNITGNVLLNDSDNHSGTTISFYNIIYPDVLAAQSVTDSLGNYSLSLTPGSYYITWDNYGYISQELADYIITSDLNFDQVIMQSGLFKRFAVMSGNWASGSVYHVLCDITILRKCIDYRRWSDCSLMVEQG